MKKLFITALACLCLPVLVRAQIPVVDGLSNKSQLNQIIKWVQDYAKQTGQQINLSKILSENTTTQEKITALLDVKKDIERHLYSVQEFKKLRISDLSRILEDVYGIGVQTDYTRGLPLLEEYNNYASGPASVASASQVYNLFRGGTTAYKPDRNGQLSSYMQTVKEQKLREYSLNVAVQKRKVAASMTYKRLADQFAELAQDLSAQVNAEGEHRMTTGERIKAQKLANDYLVKSLEMKAKADELMKAALQKTPILEEVDQSRQHAITRKALTKIQLH